MRTSDAGVDFIKKFESFVAKPYYPTPHDVPTIGYGTTVYPNGKMVSIRDAGVSPSKAVEYLQNDLVHCEKEVSAYVHVDLKQAQFDALVSFVYNVGETAFESSTLLKRLNAGAQEEAANEFLRWNKQKGAVLAGLTRRRQQERAMFLGES